MSQENEKTGPVVLCIMDGWGHRESASNNAVALANTPNFDWLRSRYSTSFLAASGPDVGLPEGQVGNSEVGHMNIGAGRIVMQDLPRINEATADGSLATHPLLINLAKQLTATNGTAHVMGLLSDGGVHSHQNHMLAITNGLCDAGVHVAIHGFTDGRDVLPKIAKQSIADLPEHCRTTAPLQRSLAAIMRWIVTNGGTGQNMPLTRLFRPAATNSPVHPPPMPLPMPMTPAKVMSLFVRV